MKVLKIALAFLIVSATFFSFACSNAADAFADTTEADTTAAEETKKEIEMTEEVEDGVMVYRVKRFESADGIDWLSVPGAAIDTYKWVECSPVKAYAQMVYVEDYGFVCRMTALETDPFARYTEYGDPACLDSCLELFVSFDGEKYVNIEANSAGALYVGIGSSRNDHTPAHELLTADEMISVTPTLEEGKWYITVDLPLDKLGKLYQKAMTDETFSTGYTFGGNFYKTESADNGNEHYGMWNEISSGIADYHLPEFFGKIIIE